VLLDEDLTSEFESAVDKGSIDLEDSFGIALQVGADYHVNERWLVNASARWLDLETEAEIRTDGGSKFTADIDVDPMVYTISVGYKF
jgi:outer membrane protein